MVLVFSSHRLRHGETPRLASKSLTFELPVASHDALDDDPTEPLLSVARKVRALVYPKSANRRRHKAE